MPYELRIGVTGHCDLADRASVKVAVEDLLRNVVGVLEGASAAPLGAHGTPDSRIDRIDRWLTRRLATATGWLCPKINGIFGRTLLPVVPVAPESPTSDQQTTVKLTAISALAKGADQIVARVVCDLVRNPEERNRYLEAVLPFPEDVYLEDFDDEGDRAEFYDLLALDKGKLFSHPTPTILYPDFPLDSADPPSPVPRWQAYAAAGRHVVDASEIVVSIWDPLHKAEPGGTAETTRYALDRGRIVLWLNPADLAAGPFLLRIPDRDDDAGDEREHATWLSRMACAWHDYWHGTPNAHEEQVDEALQRRAPPGLTLEQVPTRAKQLSRHFHRLAAYNRDTAASDSDLRHKVDRVSAELEQLVSECGLPHAVAQTLRSAFVPRLVRADTLSVRYRELRDFAARLWPLAAAFLVTLLSFQIIFLPNAYWLAFIELAVLLLCYASYRVSLFERWHEKWLNDRRLAESFRAALFIAPLLSEEHFLAASREHRSGHVHDPLPFYKPASTWFVATLKRYLIKERRRFAAGLDVHQHLKGIARYVRRGWLLEQAGFHASFAARNRRREVRARRCRLLMIGLIMTTAVVHGLGVGHGEHHAGASLGRIDLWIAFFTVVLPAWAAAGHVMGSLDDRERLAERSTLMASLLEGLAEQIERVTNFEELQAFVSDAERIMALESQEWAESMVDRKPEFTG